MSRKRQKEVQALFYQYQNMWLTRILRLACSSIKWDGLPKEIDMVYLENCLNKTGSAIIVYDEILNKYAVGQNGSVGQIDIYGYPQDRKVIFMNGLSANYTPDTSVIIYNNSMRMADLWIYEMWANELADIDMAVRVNIQSQKTMPIIPGTQQQKLSIEQVYSSIENNMPYVILDSASLNVAQLKESLQFDNRRSFTSDLMMEVQRNKWCEILSMIGINNINYGKKERVNVPEINSNLDEIMVMRRDRLNSRERACDLMKEKLGLSVEVQYYDDMEGGEFIGMLYNGSEDNMSTSMASKKSGTTTAEKTGNID